MSNYTQNGLDFDDFDDDESTIMILTSKSLSSPAKESVDWLCRSFSNKQEQIGSKIIVVERHKKGAERTTTETDEHGIIIGQIYRGFSILCRLLNFSDETANIFNFIFIPKINIFNFRLFIPKRNENCLSWHHSHECIAVGLADVGAVAIHSFSNSVESKTEILKPKIEYNPNDLFKQEETDVLLINCLAWRPHSASSLAVGIQTSYKGLRGYIQLWGKGKCSSFQGSWRLVSNIPTICPPTTMEWSPDGRKLAVDEGYRVLLIESFSSVSSKYLSPNRINTISSISWSSDGKILSVFYSSGHLFLWNFNGGDLYPKLFTVLRFSTFYDSFSKYFYKSHTNEPICQWLSMISRLICVKDSKLYCLMMNEITYMKEEQGGEKTVSDKLTFNEEIDISVSEFKFEPSTTNNENIKLLAVDKASSQKIALTFDSSNEIHIFDVIFPGFGCPVAIFIKSVKNKNKDIYPKNISFSPQFIAGSLLSVIWSDDTVQICPILFFSRRLLSLTDCPVYRQVSKTPVKPLTDRFTSSATRTPGISDRLRF
eukprot:GHVL01013213.1.p1 GENE.GHVL01013213.1~~GHVL01013213.1.p1  ORF type:complete len:541 (+),score=111.12 GHVL01013213.1:53-1675(+)